MLLSRKRQLEEVEEPAKHVCHGVASHLQAVTLEKLRQAQLELAKKPVAPQSTDLCYDCNRELDPYDERNCILCERAVCVYCSTYRGNVVKCLNCIC